MHETDLTDKLCKLWYLAERGPTLNIKLRAQAKLETLLKYMEQTQGAV